MEIEIVKPHAFAGAIFAVLALSGCGSIKEKTAPCKRPAELTSYAEDPRQDCGAMQAVNTSAVAFTAIGLK